MSVRNEIETVRSVVLNWVTTLMNEILQIIWDKEIILFIYLLNQLWVISLLPLRKAIKLLFPHEKIFQTRFFLIGIQFFLHYSSMFFYIRFLGTIAIWKILSCDHFFVWVFQFVSTHIKSMVSTNGSRKKFDSLHLLKTWSITDSRTNNLLPFVAYKISHRCSVSLQPDFNFSRVQILICFN